MKSVSRSEQHIFFNSYICTPPLIDVKARPDACDFPVDSALWSALISWKFGRCNTLSGIPSFSQVSVKHRAAELEISLLIQESRRSSPVLLGREWRFTRWVLGYGVLNARWRSFNMLHRLQCPAKSLNNKNPVKDVVVCSAECSAVHPC